MNWLPKPFSRLARPGRNGSLRRDVIFGLLSNDRRVFVVEYVDAHGATTLRELSIEIACEENGVTEAALGGQQRKRVYVSLYQTNLPKLASHGVIDYDPDRGTVAPGAHLGDLTAVLDAV